MKTSSQNPFRLPALVAALGLTIVATHRLHAATFTVTTTNISGPGSLLAAIAQANGTPGDNEITFSVTNGVTLGLPLPTITNSVVITGNATPPTVISGGGTLPLFTFAVGTTNCLSNLVLANGNTTNNGAALNNSGTLYLSSCLVSNNSATNGFGGGIINGGIMVISSSVIAGNQAEFGGGIYNTGALAISKSTFVQNLAIGGGGYRPVCGDGGSGGGGGGFGGALFSFSSTVFTTNSTFFQNTASGGTGGNGGHVTSCSTPAGSGGGSAGGSGGWGNSGTNNMGGDGGFGSGGGGGGAGRVEDATLGLGYNGGTGGNGGFGGGGGGGGGGGIARNPANNIYVYTGGGIGGYSTFAGGSGLHGIGNTGTGGGAGGGGAGLGGSIFVQGGNCVLVNCTVASNSATGGPGGLTGSARAAGGQGIGGGVFNYAGTVSLLNTIVAGNIATNGSPDLVGSFVTSGYNLIGNNQGATNLSYLDFQNVGANLGPLQNNGGLTPTCAPLSGSLAIGNGISTGAPATDQRGVPRPQGGGFDIGAVEMATGSPWITGAAMVKGSGFTLNTIFDATNKYRIQASTNLTTWVNLITNDSGGTLRFIDTATNLNRRYYRTVTP